MFLPKAQETGDGKLKSLTLDEQRLFSSRSRKGLDFLFGAIYCFIRGETGGQSSWTIKGNLFSVKLQIRARARHHSEKDALNLQLEGKCQKLSAPPKQVISCSTNLGQMCATDGDSTTIKFLPFLFVHSYPCLHERHHPKWTLTQG